MTSGTKLRDRLKHSRTGQRAKEPLRSLLGKLGYDLVPFDRHENEVLAHLLRTPSIGVLYDVGANQGQYAIRARQLGYGGRIVSVEPGAAAFSLLSSRASRDSAWTAHNVALGRQPGTMALRVSANSVSSSLLPINQVHVSAAEGSAVVGEELVTVTTLDALAAEEAEECWLKVDTQGFELEVLGGADAVLSRCKVVQMELSFTELYAGQAPWLEVLRRLEGVGFSVFDIIPGFRSPTGRLLQCDVLATRD